VRLFTDYEDSSAEAVPDPYYTRDFDGALDLIECCARGLTQTLEQGLPEVR
jgi:protein-tyrosine phosphatase